MTLGTAFGEAMTAVHPSRNCCTRRYSSTTGEIALLSPEPNAAKTEAYFKRALAVAREQQAKS
jgi:hypothetical protein